MQFLAAVTLIAELGDLSRFDNLRQLMSCKNRYLICRTRQKKSGFVCWYFPLALLSLELGQKGVYQELFALSAA